MSLEPTEFVSKPLVDQRESRGGEWVARGSWPESSTSNTEGQTEGRSHKNSKRQVRIKAAKQPGAI
jgi:hypothetical protein